ncbi:MAG: K+/H+ antiporter, partial [Solobacterium sp.]|nr:K+/H+ antiporter [Solobacterium sp.]
LVPAAKRLNMIDAESDVMKTCTDYSDETQVEFVKLQLKDNHPGCNKKVKDISRIDDMLLVLIIRGKEKIVPRGDTVLMKGDLIVLSALSLNDDYDVMLKETVIDNDHEWVNKKLSEIKMDKGLVILIKRNDEILIPKGDTVIEADDVLVIS